MEAPNSGPNPGEREKEPLTARSTVVHATSTSTASNVFPGFPTLVPKWKAAVATSCEEGGAQAATNRKKVPLEKGYSQVDWLRLTQTHPDLKGPPRLRKDITWEEVKQHSSRDDAWTVINGKVYNITHYLPFHPGGVEILMKVAGRDGTALFQKYHPWVNYHALLQSCCLGLLRR